MKARAVRSLSTVSLLALIALAAAGCGRQAGQYAEAKESWTEPRPAEVEDALRNRLVTTQRDN